MKITTLLFATSALAFGCAMPSLNLTDESTPGALGHASFSRGVDKVDRPFLVGTSDELIVKGRDRSLPPDVVAAAADAKIVSVDPLEAELFCVVPAHSTGNGVEGGAFRIEPGESCPSGTTLDASYLLPLSTSAPGTTDLVLRAKDGSEIDRLTVRVAEAASFEIASLAVTGGASDALSTPPTLASLSKDVASYDVELRVLGANHEELFATKGVETTSDDPTIVEVIGLWGPQIQEHDVWPTLHPHKAGTTTLRVRSGKAETAFQVTVK